MKLFLILCILPLSIFGKTYKFYGNIETDIKDPFQMRDPFKKPLIKSKTAKKVRVNFLETANIQIFQPSLEYPWKRLKL